MRVPAIVVVMLWSWLPLVFAQDANSNSATTVCTFEDGQEISVQYNNSATPVNEPRNGKPWRAANSPMILFAQTELTINKVDIAPGAYSLWFIPDKKNWTMAVNKNVKADSPYDQAQDLVREPMEVGELPQPSKQPDIGFAHMASKTCNLRIYYGRIGAWADVNEK
jgi:Protein of unknown function (DUF2911)